MNIFLGALILANLLLVIILVSVIKNCKDKQSRTGTGLLLSVLIADIATIAGGIIL